MPAQWAGVKSGDSYLLAIDQGTSGTLASLYDLEGRPVASHDVALPSIFPSPGWVEQDPYELLESVRQAVNGLIQATDLQPGQIECAGLAHQGESLLLWDRLTGKPIYNLISWQCTRSAELCLRLAETGQAADFRKQTGLPLDPAWPATKVPWVLEHVPEARELLRVGRLAFSQPDAWLLYQLTEGTRCVTEPSTASRSGFYGLAAQSWDEGLKRLFQADGLVFPEIANSVDDFGMAEFGAGWRIPMRGCALDQAAALLGQGCLSVGEAKISYGTCGALWQNAGPIRVEQPHLGTSVAWRLGGRSTFALSGETGATGSVMAWLRDKLRLPWADGDLAGIAEAAGDQPGLMLVPAFRGLDAPQWAPQARAALFGLRAETGLEQILRAGLEAIAFSIRGLVELIAPEGAMKVDGGMSANDYLMQFQADILGMPLWVAADPQSTSAGVAFLAGLAQGCFADLAACGQAWRLGRIYEPRMSQAERDERYDRWKKAVRQVCDMASPESELLSN